MIKALFVADAHITGIDDPSQRSLCAFLDSLLETGAPEKFVMLGDIFDFWAGYNDVVAREYAPLLERLSRLKERGTGIIYLEGNHDFSMGPFFTDTLKAEVHADSHVMTLDGMRVLLCHGDTLDGSVKYRLWRAFLRSVLFRAIVKILPPAAAWDIARRLSGRSRLYGGVKQGMDRRFRAFAGQEIAGGIDAVIMGHTHASAVDQITAGDRSGVYANPGGWSRQASYLIYEDGRFRLKMFTQGGRAAEVRPSGEERKRNAL